MSGPYTIEAPKPPVIVRATTPASDSMTLIGAESIKPSSVARTVTIGDVHGKRNASFSITPSCFSHANK